MSAPWSDRAVSTTLGYALTLGISTLLITGLVIAGGDYIQNQREQAIRTELNVLGQQVASDVQAADRLREASGGSGAVTIRRDLPDRVAGATYSLKVEGSGSDPYLKLESGDPDVTVTVDLVMITENVDTELKVEGGAVQGGRIIVETHDIDGDPDIELRIKNA